MTETMMAKQVSALAPEQIEYLRQDHGLHLKDDHTVLPDPSIDAVSAFNAAGNWCKFWNGAGCRHQHKASQGQSRRGNRGRNNNNSKSSKNITVHF